MRSPTPEGRRAPRHASGDDGAALVEFALIVPLLFLLVFGIISFGLVLSFKQDLTRVAAEGARAGAVAYPANDSYTKAVSITNQAMTAAGMTCGAQGLSCYVTRHDCTVPAGRVIPDPTPNVGDCITVELVYNRDADSSPVGGSLPMLSDLLPGTIVSRSVAKVNT